MQEIENYQLVIVGAGCVGMAAAYYAAKSGIQNVCLLEKSEIGNPERYWSSSFSARQNRVQYNEEYLTRFVLQSNKQWTRIENDFAENGNPKKFLHTQGALWFGDKDTTTSQGNIKAANAVITVINSHANSFADRVESTYIQKLMEGSPEYMKAFKPRNKEGSSESEWDSWSVLYQPDGGSVNMQQCYKSFYNYIQGKVTIKDQVNITKYSYHKPQNEVSYNQFTVVDQNGVSKLIRGEKVLLSLGVYTPYFLSGVMGFSEMTDNPDQFSLQEYVASYFKVSPQKQEIYDTLPNYYNFLKSGEDNEYSGYGFRYHNWDNLPSASNSKFVKVGTMNNIKISKDKLPSLSYKQIPLEDERVQSAIKFASNRMNGLIADDPENKHYPCPIIFYPGRETILDYLFRNNKSIVVQTGGWVGKYFPLLAKTSIQMLFQRSQIEKMRLDESNVIGNFLNRTRFPIRKHVDYLLASQKIDPGVEHFETMIIGAGCSGLYTAYRLNEAKNQGQEYRKRIGNIGVFDLADRISGRLKSFHFKGVATPMELGGMRYIPTNHVLLNKMINTLGIPYLVFEMNGDPIQDYSRKAYLRNDYYSMSQWSFTQKYQQNLHTSYRIQGPIMGMDAFQMISFSMYMVVTAPENVNVLAEMFLEKTEAQILQEKTKLAELGENVHYQSSWYRNWKNYVYQDQDNNSNFMVNMSLKQWNQLKPTLVFRFRYSVTSKQVYLGQEVVDVNTLYPLYKFGFQNVIEAQFGHEAYQFISEQNGYFSNTSNASYLDQVMTYLLDFGNVSYRTLAGGFDQLNYSIANILLDNEHEIGFKEPSKEGIYLQHKLVDVIKINAQNAKYEVVFHVPNLLLDGKKKNLRCPLSYCRKYDWGQKQQRYNKEVVIPGTDFREIRFTTNNLVFGMPRRSVENLYNDIALFKRGLGESYSQNYQQQKQQLETIFDFVEWSKIASSPPEKLSPQLQEQLKNLLALQEQSFTTGQELSSIQKQRLEQLSSQKFYSEIQRTIPHYDQIQTKKRKIFMDEPINPNNLLDLSASTQIMPSMKVVMNFDRSWWNPDKRLNEVYKKTYKNTNLVNSVENMRGVSITDLPVRQTLYFSEGEDNLLLGSYNDMITTEFWTTLHNNFSEIWAPKNQNKCFMSEHGRSLKVAIPQKSENIYPAKTVLVRQILNQLRKIHQIDVKEEWLKECVYQFWGGDIFGGGYHNFYSGYYIPSVMKTMRKPWQDENIHIVGQAYSNETGWVEGAYQTCEMMVQEHFGLSPLVQGYYAGY